MKREKDKKYIKEYETYGTQLDDLKKYSVRIPDGEAKEDND